MQEKKAELASFVLIGLVLASIFAGAVSGGAGVGELEEGAEENENPHQAEKDNGAVSDVNVTASSTTCNSCSDCTNKLNGKYDTVKLTRDLINVKGSCITFGANNVVFSGNGHKIDGDDTGEFESGITMSSKSGNTIKNCDITDFESGITLYGSSKNKIYDNEVSSNYYDGIWISTNSDSNNIHDNLIEDNGNYGVYFSSDSNNNIFSKNVVCSNPTDIHDYDKNSGDDNTCDTAHNWNDDGTNGCTYSCPAEKPDLIITEIICDRANDRIGYKIKNIGDATAPKGHYTTLFVDGAFKIKEQVDVNLAPGASSQRYFDYYSWQCSPPQDNVKVCADYGDFVDESNEKNNCREETCQCAPPEKPDLIITDVWNEDSTICYQVRNIGNATAPKGHYTALSIDGEPVVNDLVDVELGPKERLKQCFNYGWQCSPPDDTITVCADHKDVVDEADETNNCRNETWKCDNTPPVIVSGPVVSEITPSSVAISWTTNEDSDSLVRFGRTAGKYGDQKFSLKMKQEHKVILTDLLPSTTYRYVVQSTDASENIVVSRDGLFETGPVPDDEPPVISSLNITRGKGDFLYYEMSADASDNIGVERVEFYMDDELIGTDYSAPYQCHMTPVTFGMTWAEFFEEHTVAVVAFDDINTEVRMPAPFDPPYECEKIGMDMRDPDLDYTIYIEGDTVPAGTIVPIEVYAALEQESCVCTDWRRDGWCRSFSCTTTCFPISKVEFYVNHAPIPHTSSHLVYTGNWDASGFPPGTYTIRVDAISSEDCKQMITREVSIVRGEPSLDVSRDVTRIGNYFRVELSVENHCRAASFQVDSIKDSVVGFQAIRKSADHYSVDTDYMFSTKRCDIEIDLFDDTTDTITLGPGNIFRIRYLVVPILYERATHSIGDEEITVHYYDPSGLRDQKTYPRPCHHVKRRGHPDEGLSESINNAFRESDYLIVTNPSRMDGYYSDTEINKLLSLMASLGKEKEGVLGYLDIHHTSLFKRLIEPDGDWSSRLTTDWTSTGYLLIVGETEIVPSFERSDSGIRDATGDWDHGPVYHVTCVDNEYADISGDDNLPELIVGRIIGDSADQLMTPIRTSLLDQFERTNALVVSGIDEDDPNAQTSFENNADEIADILDDEFTVDQMYGSDWDDATERLTEFKNRARDKDVLFYRDHGITQGWSDTISIWQFPVNFGNSYPFVFGMACLTGHFEGHHCIGEAFLDNGAGVYIGATELSSRSRNNPTGKLFFDKWVNSPISIGQALKETKRELDVSDDRYRLWVMEYNLYGDPKYGASSVASSSSASIAQEASQQPLSSLGVTVPDYEVTSIAGLDHVEISGGGSITGDRRAHRSILCRFG